VTTVRRLLIVLALLAACSGTETGNPGGAEVEIGLRASDPDIVSIDGDGGGDRVESLVLAIDEAALVGCEADPSSTPVFHGKAIVDLVPGARADGIPAGEYCGIRLMLAPRELPAIGNAPAVRDASIAARGVRRDGVPFTVASRASLTVVVTGEPFHVDNGDTLLLAFDASRWLGGGILGGAPVVDGRATIDGTGDSAVQFERQTAAELFRDANGNGAVDVGETMPLAATASSGAAR
jgi:hypothetical protein